MLTKDKEKDLTAADQTAEESEADYAYLLELIPEGKENAISRVCLGNKLGLTARETSKVVHSARIAGCLILSGPHGYYVSDNLEEVQEFYDLMQKRSVSLLAALKHARRFIKEHEGEPGDEETDELPRDDAYRDSLPKTEPEPDPEPEREEIDDL